ncbi:MAG: excinuclease ABC subunit UvrC [Gammaproteobacteria bacterium]|nr:excinuclease ABC subunit UvrC [Gammaproteobacteria bacterium]
MSSKPVFDSAAFLKTLTGKPGVYRMLDAQGLVLYVGKARNLKRRVTSYFHKTATDAKTQSLMEQMASIEVTVTHTETEALILESTLIKQHKPRYNILLRDDKSYPYLLLTDDEYPRLAIYRGAKTAHGCYFGPYPSATAAHESLHLLQRIFRLRQCEDSFFRNRTRPCLQYQIKRCTAPCTGLISQQNYAQDVRHAVLFLQGKSREVTNELVRRMEHAAQAQDFEQAAMLRDQVAHVRQVQETQHVSGEGGDLDVIAVAVKDGMACVQVFYVRAGRNLGNKGFILRLPGAPHDGDGVRTLSAFLPQYYLGADSSNGRQPPAEILLSHELPEARLLERALAQAAGRRVKLSHSVRGARAAWLRMAQINAEQALAYHLSRSSAWHERFAQLQTALRLEQMPERIECFDISHTQGEAAVASCVVFDINGPLKSAYRRFNIENVTPGDDYAALKQALTRRYTRIKRGEGSAPDVLFIDGGKGQLAQAQAVMEELQMDGLTLVAIAKGPERKPGQESLFVQGRAQALILPGDSPALHLIQQLRDEAHRFAITGHRKQRAQARLTSPLEGIQGIGPRRRRQLLLQFGGLQGVARAGVEDLAKVPGISKQLAQKVYEAFH